MFHGCKLGKSKNIQFWWCQNS